MRAFIFFLSIVFHLIFVQWFIHLRMPIKIVYTEKIVDIRLLKNLSIDIPAEVLRPKVRKSSTIYPVTKNNHSINPAQSIDQTQIQEKLANNNGPSAAPTVPNPTNPLPSDNSLPGKFNFSVYSKDYQDVLNNYNRQSRRFKNETLSAEIAPDFQFDRFELKTWAQKILPVIQKNWNIPLVTETSPVNATFLTVIIEKDGTIFSNKVKKSAGVPVLDQAALNAVALSTPLPALPGDFPARSIELTLQFDYHWK